MSLEEHDYAAMRKKDEQFMVDNHFREADKCCANCKFGENGWEGEATCHHPSLIGENYVMQHNVCDSWVSYRARTRRTNGGE